MQGRDRRKHQRIEGRFPVDLLNMGDDPRISPFETIVTGEAFDVSRQGMQLRIGYEVPIGSFVSAIFYWKNHESICLCEVMWKKASAHSNVYGLYIREWSKLDKELEKQLIEADQSFAHAF